MAEHTLGWPMLLSLPLPLLPPLPGLAVSVSAISAWRGVDRFARFQWNTITNALASRGPIAGLPVLK